MKTRLIVSFIFALSVFAQEKKADSEQAGHRFFRIDLVVKEVDEGRIVNSRAYSTVTQADSNASIRNGNKVPINSNYMDVGIDIDMRRVRDLGSQIEANIVADVSSLASTSSNPIIRHNRWDALVVVPLRKPTIVFSSDDLTSKGKMQLEVTANPVP